MLLSTVKYDSAQLSNALQATAAHRGSKEVLENWSFGIKLIEESKVLHARWDKYCREYSYARGISFIDVCGKIKQALMIDA
jgi:hypothetical protein